MILRWSHPLLEVLLDELLEEATPLEQRCVAQLVKLGPRVWGSREALEMAQAVFPNPMNWVRLRCLKPGSCQLDSAPHEATLIQTTLTGRVPWCNTGGSHYDTASRVCVVEGGLFYLGIGQVPVATLASLSRRRAKPGISTMHLNRLLDESGSKARRLPVSAPLGLGVPGRAR